MYNFDSLVRSINSKVELFQGSTLLYTFKSSDRIISFDIQRTGEGKFFGYGIVSRLNLHLIDKLRELHITTDITIKVYLNDYKVAPLFKVSEVHRDENTNELSITAYCKLADAESHLINEILDAETPDYNLTMQDMIRKIVNILGIDLVGYINTDFADWELKGANLEGTENLREVLNSIAEATQTIYYLDNNDNLTFKRLDRDGTAVYTIDKNKYIELTSRDNKRLQTICSTNDLEDSISASTTEIGSTQFVRNNCYWDLREDRAQLVDKAIAAIGGLTIGQFECSWTGNPTVQLGDKIALIKKDGQTKTSFLLDDTLTYDGGLNQNTQWSYEENEEETADNPTTIGETIKDTYAKIDKANKQIDIVVKDSQDTKAEMVQIQLNQDGIYQSVETINSNIDANQTDTNKKIDSLTKRVEQSMTDEEVNIKIQTALQNDVNQVTTETGFTFNKDGLSVSKSGSEMTTTITEDGMKVFRDSEAVLVANNHGVDAENLHATTYLIIGKNSRFEDMGDRTGCFYIGG